MKQYQTYLFDLDGTVYLGESLLPGAKETIEALTSRGAHVRYITNNPTRSGEQYAQRLTNMGLPTTRAQVLTSVDATILWLTKNAPQARVYPIGEEPLTKALGEAGIALSDTPGEIDIVLASFDRTFAYDKLQIAFDALWYHGNARLMSTNPDRYCPYPGGRGEPDAAAIVGAIEASTGVHLEHTFGKPSPMLAQIALDTVPGECAPERTIMVGDRLHTDIAMGIAAGMDTALVLTGDSTEAEIQESAIHPTWVLEGIAGLVE